MELKLALAPRTHTKNFFSPSSTIFLLSAKKIRNWSRDVSEWCAEISLPLIPSTVGKLVTVVGVTPLRILKGTRNIKNVISPTIPDYAAPYAPKKETAQHGFSHCSPKTSGELFHLEPFGLRFVQKPFLTRKKSLLLNGGRPRLSKTEST